MRCLGAVPYSADWHTVRQQKVTTQRAYGPAPEGHGILLRYRTLPYRVVLQGRCFAVPCLGPGRGHAPNPNGLCSCLKGTARALHQQRGSKKCICQRVVMYFARVQRAACSHGACTSSQHRITRLTHCIVYMGSASRLCPRTAKSTSSRCTKKTDRLR